MITFLKHLNLAVLFRKMGIVIRQTIKGTIWSYLGVIIGFITTSYFFPNYLTTEVVGLLGLLVSYSQLFGSLSLLGLPGVTSRLFSYFRNKENGHNGFLFIALLFHLAGIVLFLLAFFLFKPLLIETNIDDSPLLVQYLYLLVPLTVAVMLFVFLDTFNKVLYDAVFGTFLQEFLQRFLILAVTILYVTRIISLEHFVIGYAIAIMSKAIIILFFLLRRKAIDLKPRLDFLDRPMRRELASVAIFSLVSGMGSLIVFNLDKIIINQMLDLSNTGVYTIAFYFGSLIAMPSRPLLKISGTLIADAWRNNDLGTISRIYNKSCLNQLIIGGLLFLGVWANIDNVLIILGDDYLEGRWVIFFIGMGYLIDMSTGANGQIINFSKYYRTSLLFISILIGLVVVSMRLLIPLWGIVGAAVAIAASLLFNNLMRFLFLRSKFGFQPFTIHSLLVIAIYLCIYFIQLLLPAMPFLPDLLVRSTFIVVVSFLIFWNFPISEDLKYLKQVVIAKLKERKIFK
ncbi:lipopolysaccharide biosynthesis protein [Roseimarinus sediminis]|uniref:lipopolysaccharide biosynthesis protein n=1 Tax=Roseimarinus sediminis TaxID=1610899 RepID=UPI003D1CE03D